MSIEYRHHKRMCSQSASGRVITFGVQGDTQYNLHDASREASAQSQLQFINRYCDAAFHVGDVVNDLTSTTEWNVARDYWIMGIKVPYLVCPGNWDMGTQVGANTTDPQIQGYTRCLQDNGYAQLAFSGVPADGDTVTIGDEVYRFKNTMAAANDVLIEAGDADGTMTNLWYALNHPDWSAQSGTKYHASTGVNAKAYGDRTWRTDVTQMLVYGREDQLSAVSVSESGANISWTGAVSTLSAAMSSVSGYGGVMDRPWFLQKNQTMRRWAIVFETSGVKWLGISIPFGPTTEDMDWADGVATDAAYADRWVVLLSHSIIHREGTDRQPGQYVQAGDTHAPDDSTYWGSTNGYPGAGTPAAYRSALHVGQSMWTNYLSTWDNLKFALNGHHFDVSTFPQGYRRDTGNAGQQVHLFHVNYQGPSQLLTSMRMIRMVETAGQIQVRTFSPRTNEARYGSRESFNITDSEVWTPPNA